MAGIDWNRPPQEIFDRIFDEETRTYIHTRLHAFMSPYVPMDSGMLDQNVNITPYYVEYKVPYAHYQWTGKVFVDDRGSTYARRNTSKHATNRDIQYSKDQHPLASDHWDRAMWATKGQDFCDDITAYLRSR